MKLIYLVLFVILIAACSLSADQEQSLHNAMVSYVNAHNEGEVTAYVAFTHPNAVAYYKSQGDSIFKLRYDLSDETNPPFLQDGTIRKIETNENKIHVMYTFTSIHIMDFDNPSEEVMIYAVSEDNGVSWFFVDEDDYMDDRIVAPKERLIK